MAETNANNVSELFDPAAWEQVAGFDFTDITYHRAVDVGVVRIAFDRPEVRNAFRPHTVDELYRALDHARTSADVGCVLVGEPGGQRGLGGDGDGSHDYATFLASRWARGMSAV